MNKQIIKIFLILYLLTIQINGQQIKNKQKNPEQIQSSFNEQLDELKTTAYREMYHKPINVSLGQELNIVLPSFDSIYNKNNVQFKILSNQEYQRTLNKLQSLDSQSTDGFQKQDTVNKNKNNKIDNKQQGTDVRLQDLPIKCRYIPANTKVYQTISKINDQTGSKSFNFASKQYIHVSSRQLLYILNLQTMALSAYYYNDLNIKFLSSFQLPRNKNQNFGNQNAAQAQKSVSMTLNSRDSQLYIFSSQGIFVVQTKTYLTNIKQLKHMSGFNPLQSNGIDKIIRGSNSYFVGMKKMNKVFIIPQQDPSHQRMFTQINKFHQQTIFPQDIIVQGSILFVLDVYKGVYIYQILSDGTVNQLFKIGLNSYGGNYKLHVYQMTTLFVNFNDFDGSKIVQINLDIEHQKAQLVRYFKNDDYISFIQTYSVLTSSTGFYLNQIANDQEIDIRQIQNSAESLLFMISNNQDIYIFPFNVDPRTITAIQNGVKINYPKAQQILHIFGDRFLIITSQTIDYVKISIQKPQISCLIGSNYNPNYQLQPQSIKIMVKSNMTTCQYRNKMFKHKIFYNQNCQLTTQYIVHFNDPQQSNIRKLITYGIVLLVVAAFIIGLFCLVQWRNQKLIVLSRLKDQILRFRNRHRRMQPFVQEQIDQRNQVQMQVPKNIQFLPQQNEYN